MTGRWNIFHRGPELFDFIVDGSNPRIFWFLRLTLEPHYYSVYFITIVIFLTRIFVFNVLQFVNFKSGFIICDNITYPDLVDAETKPILSVISSYLCDTAPQVGFLMVCCNIFYRLSKKQNWIQGIKTHDISSQLALVISVQIFDFKQILYMYKHIISNHQTMMLAFIHKVIL